MCRIEKGRVLWTLISFLNTLILEIPKYILNVRNVRAVWWLFLRIVFGSQEQENSQKHVKAILHVLYQKTSKYCSKKNLFLKTVFENSFQEKQPNRALGFV